MSEIILTEGVAPATPPTGKVTIYSKTDGRLYWKQDDGTETPLKAVGVGSGDLLADGSVPLTANWDVGAFEITALRFHSDEATLSPFTVVSQALVSNLNADKLDGLHAAAFILLSGLTADWDAGSWKITAETLESDVTTGTAPLVVASTTLVANLNADLLDGQEGSYYASVAYVDSAVAGGVRYKGVYDASTNTPDLDTSPIATIQGDMYICSVAGTFFTTPLEIGDALIAEIDSATVEADWSIVQGNIQYTAAEIKTLYESNADTNEFDDTEQTKLAGIDANASLKSNLVATVAPTVNEDSGDGYGVGSKWVDVTGDKIYFCLDATVAAAVWQEVGSGGGGGGLTVEFKTASFTAVAGYKYMIAPAAAVVVTLPAGNDLDNIQLRPTAHNAGTYNITVNPDGAETIDNDTAFVIDQNEGYIDISYKNADTNWEVSASGSQAATLTKTRTVRTLIETIDNSGAAGKFDFANIPAGFDRLILEGMIRSDEVTASAGARIFFNADTTAANYHSQRIAGTNDTTVDFESATPIFAIVSAASAPTNAYSSFRAVVEQPDSGYLKNAVATFSTEVSATELYTGIMGVKSAITAAIDRLRVQTTDDPTSELLGVVRLYGEKDEEIGGGAGATKVRTIKTVIEKITNATAGEFDFNNIPSGYDRLIVKGRVRGDVTANTDGCNLYINADTTDTNYNCQVSGANNNVGQHWKANLPFVSSCPAASSPANAYSDLEVCMENPDGADLKCARASYGYHQDSANVHIHDNFLTSIVTAAITRLRFKSDNDPTDQLLGELTLYGEKDEEIGGGAGPVGRLVTDEIERITNATAGEFDFNNIPSGYDRLILKGQVRSDSAITTDGVLMFINSDLTAGNYHSQHHVAANGVTYEVKADSPRLAICAADNSPANLYTDVEATLENPDGSYLKACRSEFGMGYETDKSYIGQSHVISALTAAVTRLRVRTDNHATDQLFGTLILYGEKTI